MIKYKVKIKFDLDRLMKNYNGINDMNAVVIFKIYYDSSLRIKKSACVQTEASNIAQDVRVSYVHNNPQPGCYSRLKALKFYFLMGCGRTFGDLWA